MVGLVVALGDGWDTFDGKRANTIVNLKQQNDKGPTEVDISYSICQSSQEVMDALDIDASVDVSGNLGSLSAKAKFARELLQSSTSIAIVLSIKKITNQPTVQIAEFNDTFTNAAEMFKRGGDSYVSAVRQGAEYIAAYTCETKSISKKQSFAADVKAKVKNVAADFKIAVDSASKNEELTATFTHHAIGCGNIELPEADGLATFASKFNKENFTQAEVLSFETHLYDGLKGCPDMTQIVQYYNLYQRDMGSKKAYVTVEAVALKTKATINLVADVYNFYRQVYLDYEKFNLRRGKIDALINSIRDWRFQVHSNPMATGIQPLDLDQSVLEVPIPDYDFVTNGYAGGNDKGQPFNDVELGMIMKCIYPTSIQVRSGLVIDRLETTYAFEKGGSPITQKHGGESGALGDLLQLTAKQRVVNVDTWDYNTPVHGWVLKAMKLDVESHGQVQFGNPDGGNYHPQTKSGGDSWTFVGWSGRADEYVVRLVAQYVAFNKPTWSMPVLPDRQANETGRSS